MAIKPVRQFLFLIAFALWFGGFTFYATIVVPIANELLEDTVEFGFVTQRVTHWINAQHAVFLCLTVWELASHYRRARERLWLLHLLALSCLISGAALIGLLLVHGSLDQMMNSVTLQVQETQGRSFYATHALYLNLSALAWLCGILQLIGFLVCNYRSSSRD